MADETNSSLELTVAITEENSDDYDTADYDDYETDSSQELTVANISKYSDDTSDETDSSQEFSLAAILENSGKRLFEIEDPEKFSIFEEKQPRTGGDISKGNRSRRRADICPVVYNFKNATVKCQDFESFMACHIYCPYNASLQGPSGKMKNASITCKYRENVWEPFGFDALSDCKREMNCKVKLLGPGKLECYEPDEEPIYCNIRCGGNYATPSKKYECLDKNFAKTLPSCAALQDIGEI